MLQILRKLQKERPTCIAHFPCTTFPDYLLDHNIRQYNLFVVQTLLEIAEL